MSGTIDTSPALNNIAVQSLTRAIFNAIKGGTKGEPEPWGHFTMAMNRQATKETPIFRLSLTAQGDYVLGVNPRNFSDLPLEAASFCLKHASMHIVNGHISSRAAKYIRTYGPKIFGLAADLVVNSQLNGDEAKELGKAVKEMAAKHPERFVAPDGKKWEPDVLLPEDLGFPGKLSTLEYCEKLDQLVKDYGEQILNQSGDRDQDFKDQLEKMGVKFEKNADGTKGNPMPGQAPPKGLTDKLMNGLPTGLDSVSQECDDHMADNKAKCQIKQLEREIEALKARGLMPDEALDFIKSLDRESKVSWVEYLRRAVGTAISEEKVITRRRISRRAPDFYLGRKTDRKVRVLFTIDTSGSMGVKELRCVESEIKDLANKGADVFIMNCDCNVPNAPVPFKKGDSIDKFFGGGGTDFQPAFDYAETMEPKPDMIVFFTDGWGGAIHNRPNIKSILWVLTDSGMDPDKFKQTICPWGDIVVVDTGDPSDGSEYLGRRR